MKNITLSLLLLFMCMGFAPTPAAFGTAGIQSASVPHPRVFTSVRRAANAAHLYRVNPSSAPVSIQQIGFLAGSAVDVGGTSAYGQIAGDFNGDGNVDTATISTDVSGLNFSISVNLGNGDGTFASPVLTSCTFTSGDRLLSADLNEDGKSDLLLLHSGNLDAFLSNGDGSFATATSFSNGLDSIAGAVVSDINGDGHADIVMISGIPNQGAPNPSVSTMLGHGNGSFAAASVVSFSTTVSNAVLADVNTDGKLDVITSTQVFLANSSGGYQPGIALVTANPGTVCTMTEGALTVADVNGDGHPDVITADCDNNTVTAYLNNGDGTYQPGISQTAGFYPAGVAVSDVDGDGQPDIISANQNSSDVTVLFNAGDGTFRAPLFGYSVEGYASRAPLIADFNRDGTPDILITNLIPDVATGCTYLQNLGDGTFRAARNYFSAPTSTNAFDEALGVATDDLNGDGVPDVVLGTAGPNGVGLEVFLGNHDGTLLPGTNYGTTGSFYFVGTGDFNGDGKRDIVASDAYTGEINLFLGFGDGTFDLPQVFPAVSGGGGAAQLAVADFNGDGKSDVAVTGYPATVTVLFGTASGLAAPTTYSIHSDASVITAADVNGDGFLDLLLPQGSTTSVSVLLGSANGTFLPAPDVNIGHLYPGGLTTADFNGDGRLDIAVTVNDPNAPGIIVALGNGDGSFQPATLYQAASHQLVGWPILLAGINAVDVDKDGKFDLVYADSEVGVVGILYGFGDGTFSQPVEFAVGGYPYQLATADLNGDGASDMVVSGATYPGVTVMINTGGDKVTLSSSSNPVLAGQSISFTATITKSVTGLTATPSGTVTFLDGTTSIGTAAVTGGHAVLSVATLTAGTHSITARYSGDGYFVANTSAAYQEVITAPAAQGFQISATPASAIVQAGHATQFTVTVAPVNGYNGTVSLSCFPLPSGLSCKFSPASVSTKNGTVQAVLTVTAAGFSAKAEDTKSPNLLASITFGCFGFVLLGTATTQRRRLLVAIIGWALLVTLTLALTGCGGGGGGTPTTFSDGGSGGFGSNNGNPPGPPQTIGVVGTGTGLTGNGATQHVNITVQIQN